MKSKYLIFLLAVQLAVSAGAQEAIHKWFVGVSTEKARPLAPMSRFTRFESPYILMRFISEAGPQFKVNERFAPCAALSIAFHTGRSRMNETDRVNRSRMCCEEALFQNARSPNDSAKGSRALTGAS